MRPQKAASEEVLRAAAAGAKQPELWQHTGDMGHAARRYARLVRRRRNLERRGTIRGFEPCEEGDSNPHGS